jgi:hypothetical protein
MNFQKNLKVESSIFLLTKQQIVTTQMKYLLYNYKVINNKIRAISLYCWLVTKRNPKINIKIIENGKVDATTTQIHNLLLPGLVQALQ